MDGNLGTAQWADSSDVKEKFRFKDGDFWLGRSLDDEAVPLGYQDDRHICLISGSRGGKGASIIINNLCLYPGSVVVLDPKGENATVTAARRGKGSEYCEGMGQAVHVLDPFGDAEISDEYRKCFNPLDALDPNNPANKDVFDEIVDEVDRIASALVVKNKSSADPIWDQQSHDLIKGVILYVLTSRDFEGRRNLVTVRDLITRGDWEGVEVLKNAGDKEPPSAHALLFGRMQKNMVFDGIISGIGTKFFDLVTQAPKTYQSVLLSANTHTNFIDSPKMRHCLSKSDFKLSDLKTDEKGVSLYLCLPQRNADSHSGWLRMIISLLITEMERVKKQPASGHRVLMVLDEFAGLGQMKPLEERAAQIAGFGVKLFFILQGIGQLKDIYKENWEIFLSGLKIFFSLDGYGTQEYISKLLGDTEIIIESKSENKNESKGETNNDGDGVSYERFLFFFRKKKRFTKGGGKNFQTGTSVGQGINRTPQKRELIKPNEVEKRFARIEDKNHPEYPGLALVKISGENPIVIRRVNYFEDNLFVGKYHPHPDHTSNAIKYREVEVPIEGFTESGFCFVNTIQWLFPVDTFVTKNQPIAEFTDQYGDNKVPVLAPETGFLEKQIYKSGHKLEFTGGIPKIGTIMSDTHIIASEWNIPYQQPAYDTFRNLLKKQDKTALMLFPLGCLPFLAWEIGCLIGIIFAYKTYGFLLGTLALIAGVVLAIIGLVIFLAFSASNNSPTTMEYLIADAEHHKQRCADKSKNFYAYKI